MGPTRTVKNEAGGLDPVCKSSAQPTEVRILPLPPASEWVCRCGRLWHLESFRLPDGRSVGPELDSGRRIAIVSWPWGHNCGRLGPAFSRSLGSTDPGMAANNLQTNPPSGADTG